MFRHKLLQLFPLLLVAVSSATAAPVVYSFDFTNTDPHGNGEKASFTYVSPTYITSAFLTTNQLASFYLSPPNLFFSVDLSQTTGTFDQMTYTYVDAYLTTLEADDFNQPVTSDFHLGFGPYGAESVYLDRDGSYTFPNISVDYLGSGTVTFTVSSAPEPSAVFLTVLTAPVAWKYRRRKQNEKNRVHCPAAGA